MTPQQRPEVSTPIRHKTGETLIGEVLSLTK